MPSKSFEIYQKSKLSAEERKKELERAKVLLKAEEIKVEWNGHGYVKYIAGPHAEFETRTLTVFVEELPPRKSNVKHMHNSECIIHILEGKGYAEIDGKKHNWKKGDSLFIPPESYHQLQNTEPDKTARFMGICNAPLLQVLGLFKMQDEPQ